MSNSDVSILPQLPLVQRSTTSNHKAAIKAWNTEFSPVANCPLVHELTVEFMTQRSGNGNTTSHVDLGTRRTKIETLFRQFCMVILETKKKDDKFLKFGTLKQRIGGVHTYLHEKFPGCDVLNKDHPLGMWYKNVFKSLLRQFNNNAWKRGEIVGSNVNGVRDNDLLDMVDQLCEKGSCDAVKALTMGLTLYNFCGRAGELGLVSLSNMKWTDNSLFFVLPNPKVSKEQRLDVYPHFEQPQLCLFYWLATYQIVFASSFATGNEQGWLFPDLRRYYGEDNSNLTPASTTAVSTAVTGLLDSLLSNGYKSQMFRHGSADDMILNQAGRDNCAVLLGSIFRGGWALGPSESEFFNYLFKRLFITQSGKAITKYPNARMDVAMPSLNPIIFNEDPGKFVVCDQPTRIKLFYYSLNYYHRRRPRHYRKSLGHCTGLFFFPCPSRSTPPPCPRSVASQQTAIPRVLLQEIRTNAHYSCFI